MHIFNSFFYKIKRDGVNNINRKNFRNDDNIHSEFDKLRGGYYNQYYNILKLKVGKGFRSLNDYRWKDLICFSSQILFCCNSEITNEKTQ